MLRHLSLLLVLSLAAGSLFAQGVVRKDRYAVLLTAPPVARVVKAPARGSGNARATDEGRAALKSADALRHRAQLQATHETVKRAIQDRGLAVTGETFLLSNAVFVAATREEARQLRNLPGVGGVVRMEKITRKLERAKETAQVNTSWPLLGGMNNAGDGVKVAIIDTGIDNSHPAFANSPLQMPAGFPLVNDSSDVQFTNNKVIVARSYVRQLASDGIVGGDPSSDARIQLTRPDDYSARDREGHGTAMAMIVAGQQVNSPQGVMAGVAPGAWLGSYKVFGSPRINDGTFSDVVLLALEDAFADGMDIAVLSLGIPAVWGPLDDVECGNFPGVACDPFADAAGLAANSGMLVVVSAGNSGNSGGRTPSFATISSPATHPDVLSVGAMVNSREWFRTLDVAGGPNGTAGPGSYEMAIGTTPMPGAPIGGTLRDVRTTGDDGNACSPMPAGSLNGTIAFIARGSGQCTFADKAVHAQNAGAIGIIFYRNDGSNAVFAPGGLAYATIPAGLIGSSDGSALLGFLAGQGGNAPGTINPTLRAREVNRDVSGNGVPDGIITSFSARGPNIGFPLIKPEIVAVGENMYTATQRFDPNSDLFDASGYTVVDGTSFSAPLVAGVAALVLDSQAFPNFDSEQVKSAIVNAGEDLDNFDRNTQTGDFQAAYNIAMGGGEVQARWAIDSVITMSPQTLDFGELTQEDLSQGITRTISIRNDFNQSLTLSFTREAYDPNGDAASPVVWSLPSQITLGPGQEQDISFTLSGSVPSQLDLYDGVILVQGSGDPSNNIPDVKIPYLYIVGDFGPCNIIPLRGNGVMSVVNEEAPADFSVKVTDCRGLPISGVPISWTPIQGGITFLGDSGTTDDYGIVEANFLTGPEVGIQRFRATYPNPGGIQAEFGVRAIADPIINQGGIVEGAGFQAGAPVAPGSFISIFGVNLSPSPTLLNAGLVPLPLALGEVSVSIDTRDRQVSVPGSLIFISPQQINVQLPWELAGKPSAVIKVNIDDISTAVREVPLAAHSPGLFQYTEEGTNQRILATEIFRGGERLGLHGSNRRARTGDVLELFANGLGPIDGGNPASGTATPTDRLYNTQSVPEVTIGGIPAAVEFSGLAPGFVALYQVNVVVPGGLPAGEHDVVIRIGGATGSAGKLLVE
jgi:minor extracellular serine protease Vpr